MTLLAAGIGSNPDCSGSGRAAGGAAVAIACWGRAPPPPPPPRGMPQELADLMQSEPAVKKWVNENVAKRYGLVWERHAEGTREEIDRNVLPVLEHDEKRSITGDGGPDNILIEGDNYHALQILNYTHRGRIDVIYIDPPYNTGARDWKYNNDYVDGNDAYRHSKWLSFMENRLRIAKTLLKRTGSLIIAVDDYEVNQLGLLLEKLFPSWTRDLIVVVHHPQGTGSKTVSRVHEYAYVVTPAGSEFGGRERIRGENNWSLQRAGQGENNWRKHRPNSFFAIHVDKGTGRVTGVGPRIPGGQKRYPKTSPGDPFRRIYPIDRDGNERVWRYVRKTMMEKIKNGEIRSTRNGTLVVVRGQKTKPVTSVWDDAIYNAGTHGSGLLTEIMGVSNTFSYPKSLYTVRDMLQMIIRYDRDAVVLDFFAGSGTTGHAVLEMNGEDGGSRRFILCTNNENDICTGVCHPRISRVIRGYRDKSGGMVEGLGSSLRYFRIDPRMRRHMDRRKITQKIAAMLCVKESCFIAVRRAVNKYAIFKDQDGRHFGIVYAPDDVDGYLEAVRGLKRPKKTGRRPVYTYAFAHDRIIPSKLRKSPLVHTRVVPAPILNLWDRWFER